MANTIFDTDQRSVVDRIGGTWTLDEQGTFDPNTQSSFTSFVNADGEPVGGRRTTHVDEQGRIWRLEVPAEWIAEPSTFTDAQRDRKNEQLREACILQWAKSHGCSIEEARRHYAEEFEALRLMGVFNDISLEHLDSTMERLAVLLKVTDEIAEDCSRGDDFNPLETEEFKFFYEFRSKLSQKLKGIVDVLLQRTQYADPDSYDYYKRVRGRLETRYIGRSLLPGDGAPWRLPGTPWAKSQEAKKSKDDPSAPWNQPNAPPADAGEVKAPWAAPWDKEATAA